MIFKDPKTDDGTKRSQKGKVCVYKYTDNSIAWSDGLSLNNQKKNDLLQEVFRDGKLLVDENFSTIRERLKNGQNQSHYYTNGDDKGRCPQCYGNNVTCIGS